MKYPFVTDRLSVEPLRHEDVVAFVAYRQDPEIAEFQGWEPSFSIDDGLALLDSQRGIVFPGAGEWLQLGLTLRTTGELIGDVALHTVDDTECIFEVGFTLSQRHQSHGFAREAVAGLMDFVAAERGSTRFLAHTDRRNLPSLRLLLALGFREFPEKAWREEFKGEKVEVLHLEKSLP